MSRGLARFKQSDVARAIRAAQKAGAGDVTVAPDGTIRIAIAPSAVAKQSSASEDELLDRELAEFEASHVD